MANPSRIEVQVVREGTSRNARAIGALAPESVQLDERDLDDLLVFASDFARRVVLFKTPVDAGSVGLTGDFRPFFDASPAVLTARVVRANPLPHKKAFQALLSEEATPETLAKLVSTAFIVAEQLELWRKGIAASSPFGDEIGRIIDANVRSTIAGLVALDRGAGERLTGYGRLSDDRLRPFGPPWTPVRGGFLELPADTALFDLPLSDAERMEEARQSVEATFTRLFNAVAEVVRRAPGYLDRLLNTFHEHEPHLALFLAFLRLFLLVRDDGNRITRRHLDFYYRKVLRIAPRAPRPDGVHLVFQPARKVMAARGLTEHLVSTGTTVPAGKDATGVLRTYRTTEDLVVNLAAIESLRTVRVMYAAPGIGDSGGNTVTSVHAASAANSKDGQGGKFDPGTPPVWPTLGSPDVTEARLGFAVAAVDLALAEGTRTIELLLKGTLPAASQALINTEAISCALSGEKEWLDAGNVSFRYDSGRGGILLTIVLDPDFPAVVPATRALGETFGRTLPVLRVLLRPGKGPVYGVLRSFTVSGIVLTTTVSGVRTLVVRNDESLLDPTKVFAPFGSRPTTGGRFSIHSPEAMRKRLTKLDVDLEWDNFPDDFATRYKGYSTDPLDPSDVTVQMVLPGGANAGSAQGLLGATATTHLTSGTIDVQPAPLAERDRALVGQGNAFLRLALSRDFDHDVFLPALSRQTLAMAAYPTQLTGVIYETNGMPVIPAEPFTPAARGVTLAYSSIAEGDAVQLVHIHPFENTWDESAGSASPLLPVFSDEGSLYIGIRDAQPLQSLSLLFQVAEATADTDLPRTTVEWSYLSENTWIPFEDYQFACDTTNGLLTSGIVRFTLPSAMTSTHTIQTDGLSWIRASAAVNPAAVSKLLDVHAQAVQAMFVDQGNDPAHLTTPLPAGSIKKLEIADSLIEKVLQPYDSSGGRPAETASAFDTRVSEVLRHKGRAITLFDYERLVLEHFPDIYKARCVSHMNAAFRLVPGHVLLGVVPDFTRLQAADRRRPKVTLDELDRIQTFLLGLDSPFLSASGGEAARLHVRNPVYESIRMRFEIRYRPEVTAPGFYTRVLKEALVRFLSPWAFEDGAEINFGGRVFRSSLVNFVEEQPYVDYVKHFRMMRENDEADLEVIEAGTPCSVLVPDEANIEITVLEDDACAPEGLRKVRGIGVLAIDENFQVAN